MLSDHPIDVVLLAKDLEAARDFYRDKIGLQLVNESSAAVTFKCGGNEFRESFAQYDSFLDAVAGRTGINRAKIRYLVPVLGQSTKEQQERSDRMDAEKVEAKG